MHVHVQHATCSLALLLVNIVGRARRPPLSLSLARARRPLSEIATLATPAMAHGLRLPSPPPSPPPPQTSTSALVHLAPSARASARCYYKNVNAYPRAPSIHFVGWSYFAGMAASVRQSTLGSSCRTSLSIFARPAALCGTKSRLSLRAHGCGDWCARGITSANRVGVRRRGRQLRQLIP